ncbi:MAG: hypothetical protein JSV92_00330 [archaeon]|nr:MAG: hypothetical protein JSV92_00330 [archaeon]
MIIVYPINAACFSSKGSGVDTLVLEYPIDESHMNEIVLYKMEERHLERIASDKADKWVTSAAIGLMKRGTVAIPKDIHTDGGAKTYIGRAFSIATE